MTRIFRASLAGTVAALWFFAGCSGDEKSGGLEIAPQGSAGSAGKMGSNVGVDASSPDYVPGPSGGSTGTGGGSTGTGGSTPTYGASDCSALENLQDCGTTTVEAQTEPASVLLVIDKSGSMADQPTGFDSNKWDALKTALGAALPGLSAEVNLGLALYPYSLDQAIDLNCMSGCCDVPAGSAVVNVPIEASATGVPKVLAALDQTSPGGGTPTAAALAGALEYYTVGDGAALTGNRYVLLATDGGPNCNLQNTCDGEHCTTNLDGVCMETNCCNGAGELCLDDQNVIAQINALKDAGIQTFVVGIPGTETYASYLDTFAIAGGVPDPNAPPSYYAVAAQGGVQALTDTFTAITTHLVRECAVALTQEPPNTELVNVAIDCELVPFADGSGWEIPADMPDTLLLKGDACTWVQTHGAGRIDIVYGCPTLR